MANILSLTQFKGGCGKTTSAFNIAHYLAKLNYKVLMIDLDPQAHLTFFAGVSESQAEEYSVNETFTDRKPLPIVKLNSVDIVPCHISLEFTAKTLPSKGFEPYATFKKALDEVAINYDYIIIDCPPSLGILTELALISSDYVFVPSQAELLSGNGLNNQVRSLNELKTHNGLKFRLAGVFLTQYDSRKNLHKQMKGHLTANMSDLLMDAVIRENIALAECPATYQDIFSYSPDSNGAKDYEALTNEILHTIDKQKII
jgi:chromosome partitioning protein